MLMIFWYYCSHSSTYVTGMALLNYWYYWYCDFTDLLLLLPIVFTDWDINFNYSLLDIINYEH